MLALCGQLGDFKRLWVAGVRMKERSDREGWENGEGKLEMYNGVL